ncbi:MAG: hypothetical protein KGM15_14725 [Pseudomonadota bacterium]|nr:hypothetical protein [Pseudomonadota bacterium]
MRLLSSVSIGALVAAVAAPGAASAANCTSNVFGQHVFALNGASCVAFTTTYAPVSTGTTFFPAGDPGYGFVATGGGSITTSSYLALNIDTPNASGADAVLSRGAGSTITLTNGASLTTLGQFANAVQADGGGGVTLGAAGVTTTVTTTGQNAYAYFATGAGSSINATNVAANTASSVGPQALADQGASMTIIGGSITTTGRYLNDLQADNAASVTLTGTALNASGAGANALWVSNGAKITGTNLKITSSGGVDSQTGVWSGGAYNGPSGTTSASGVLKLTASSLSITGPSGYGVGTGAGGVTTLTGDAISLTNTAAGGYGVQSQAGGQTTIYAGAITTRGANAVGVQATGAGASITTGLSAGVGLGITTYGAYAHGAQADAGGSLTLAGGSVTANGYGAIGLYATGANSQITANNVVVSTYGNLYANAISADGGGAAITFNGGVASTSGQGSYVAGATSGGSVQLAGATLTATGLGSGGLFVNGSTASVTGSNLTISVKGGYDTTDKIGAVGAANQSFLGYSGGGKLTLTNSTISVGSLGGAGVYTADSGSTTIIGGSIATSGVNSTGVATQTGAATSLSGVNVATTGAGALGLYAGGVGTRLDGANLNVSTTGGYFSGEADAVLVDSGASATLANSRLTTAGDAAKGVSVLGAESQFVGTNLTIVTTGGFATSSDFRADGVYNGAAATPGAGTTGGGNVTLTDSSVAIAGDHVNGVDTANNGVTKIYGGSIATSGGQSTGVVSASGAATTIGLDALSVATTISTAGLSSTAVEVNTGGSLVLTGAKVSTIGDGSSALVLNGAGAIVGANLTIATSGGVDAATGAHATGAYNGPSGAFGGGGTMRLTNSSVATSGREAGGLSTGGGGATTFVGGSIATAGGSAPGAVAFGGGLLSLSGTRITTIGAGSDGLVVADAGSSVRATNVMIATHGGRDASNGFDAIGVYNGPGSGGTSGGHLTLANVTVTTQGDFANAFQTDAGGISKATGGAFSTVGANATAVSVLNGGALTISGAALTTSGDGSAGLIINGSGGGVTASNLTINTLGGVLATTGSHADGVYNGAFGGVAGGGVMQIADSSVTTGGTQAYGVSTGAGGTTTFLGGSIATAGAGANAARAAAGGILTIGVDAQGAGATLATAGAGAYAVVATGGGVVSLTGATIATTGDGAGGLGVNGAGSEVDAAGVTISTHGGLDSASGLHAYGVANTPYGSYATGGVMKLTDVAISTVGAGMFGVYTGAGSTTSFAGGWVRTSGANADGLRVAGVQANLSVNGVAVAASGTGAYGAAVVNGGALTLGQGMRIATSGPNAHGLYVADAGSGANLSGPVSISVAGAGAAGVYVDAGGAVAATGALSIAARTNGVFLNGATGAAMTPTAFGASGGLTLKTTDVAGAALTLAGNSTTFAATGGGLIQAAGTGVAFLNGINQTAAFRNVEIDAPAGDLIFADPAVATISFDNSLANAGTGNLAHVVGGSDLNLVALASTLIGAVVTDPGSSSTMSLANGSVWTVTGHSTLTNLNLVNSSVAFASPTNGFHTLTVNSYSGTNAGLFLNAALGGANPGADQLIINGGRATGSTIITIQPVTLPSAQTLAAARAPAAPPAVGVPVVVTTNGGTIAPNAFALAGPLLVGATSYSLQQQAGGEYLVAAPGQTPAQLSGSLATLSQSRQSQAVTSRVLGSILTGATEQINCSSCSSGFASFGSFALGVHGRWTLSPSVALMAGLSYDNYTGQGVTVNNSLISALGVRYDMVQLGRYRPFFETGVALSPYANVSFRRSYVSNLGSGVGVGDTLSRSVAAYGRAGYIWRLSPRDEAAAYSDLTRSWQSTGGYAESANPGNPFGATVAQSLDTMNIWKVGAQYTHLFGEHVEANVSAGYALAFDSKYGSTASLAGLTAAGAAAASFDWAELGGRLSYRFSKTVIGDSFVLGTVGAEPAGSQIHGGVALRMEF